MKTVLLISNLAVCHMVQRGYLQAKLLARLRPAYYTAHVIVTHSGSRLPVNQHIILQTIHAPETRNQA